MILAPKKPIFKVKDPLCITTRITRVQASPGSSKSAGLQGVAKLVGLTRKTYSAHIGI